MSKEAPVSMREFLKVKAEAKSSEIQRIINISDGVFEKITTNIPIGGLVYERRNTANRKNK
ncbi:MAG: hypothetical protein PHE73_08860 [Sulfurovaceae bacterium]|nr:hypothetical protein [Sulfurovaceae bacterium]